MNSLSMASRELESAQGAGSTLNPALITAFNAVQMTGLVLLLAVILTAWFAPSVKRSTAWFNVIISWIFSSSSFLLLMGRQTGPEPPSGLCLFQSMLIYAAPAMNACVCISFALELFFSVSSAAAQIPASRKWRLFIVSLPYVTAFLVCLEVLVIGLSRQGVVRRNAIGMYCHFTISTPSIVTGVIVIIVMISVLPVVAVTIFMFTRNWSTLRNLCAEQNGGLPLRLVIRYGVFCLLPVPIVTISLVSWQFADASPNAANVAVAIATLPIMTALIFGTQWDIFRVWMFWRRNPKPAFRPPQFKPRPSPPTVLSLPPLEEIELDIKPRYSDV